MDSSSGINISSYNSLNETVQMFFSLNDPSNSLSEQYLHAFRYVQHDPCAPVQ